MPDARELLVHGMAAAQAGDKAEARFYLEWVLRLPEGMEQHTEAWYWMSQIAADPVEKRACLESVLAALPMHAAARHELAILDGKLPATPQVDHRAGIRPLKLRAEPRPAEIRQYPCPGCGGTLVSAPGGTDLVCPFCGHRQLAGTPAPATPAAMPPPQPATTSTPVSLSTQHSELGTDEHDWFISMHLPRGHRWVLPVERTFACQACGARLALPPAHTSLACPFCASPHVVVADCGPDLIEPGGIIPFAFGAQAALAHARAWLQAERFRPRDLADAATFIPPRPIYLPFWAFDIDGRMTWVRRVFTYTADQMPAVVPMAESAGHPLSCNDLLVAATTSLPDRLLAALPFDTAALVPYTPDLLANWPAEIYRISLAAASITAQERALQHFERTASQFRGGSLGEWFESADNHTTTHITGYKLLLLPVWITEYAYQGNRYPVLISGQTGQARGDIPRKVWEKILDTLKE